jgi:hypothetical protein
VIAPGSTQHAAPSTQHPAPSTTAPPHHSTTAAGCSRMQQDAAAGCAISTQPAACWGCATRPRASLPAAALAQIKNVANTNVHCWGDSCWAMFEAGQPYRWALPHAYQTAQPPLSHSCKGRHRHDSCLND